LFGFSSTVVRRSVLSRGWFEDYGRSYLVSWGWLAAFGFTGAVAVTLVAVLGFGVVNYRIEVYEDLVIGLAISLAIGIYEVIFRRGMVMGFQNRLPWRSNKSQKEI